MKRSVIFCAMGTLLLRDIKRNEEGRITFGWVKNGGWGFEVRKGEQLAKSGNYIVTRRPDTPFIEIPIPDSVEDNYSVAIEWAEKMKEQA